MGRDGLVPGSVRLHLVDGLPLLRPDEQVFEAVIKGRRNHQLARNLSPGSSMTRTARSAPLPGTPMRCRGSGRRSTSMSGRSISGPCTDASAPPCATIRDPYDSSATSWPTRPTADATSACGTSVPTQSRWSTTWNAATHADEAECEPERRAFTRLELEAFFDYADEEVLRVRGNGCKGWLPAFRDATLFKVVRYGLRRNETRMLDLTDGA